MNLKFLFRVKKLDKKQQDKREKNLFIRGQLNEIIKKGLKIPVQSFNL